MRTHQKVVYIVLSVVMILVLLVAFPLVSRQYTHHAILMYSLVYIVLFCLFNLKNGLLQGSDDVIYSLAFGIPFALAFLPISLANIVIWFLPNDSQIYIWWFVKRALYVESGYYTMFFILMLNYIIETYKERNKNAIL